MVVISGPSAIEAAYPWMSPKNGLIFDHVALRAN